MKPTLYHQSTVIAYALSAYAVTPRDTLLAASERMCSAGSPTWSHATPGESVQDSAGTPPTTTSAPGSPWALASSAGGMQTREIGEPTLPDHEEQGGDVAERTGPTGPRHPRQQSQSPQAPDELNAQGIPLDYGAGARREERLEQREEQIARTTPHGSGGELSPHRPNSSGLAPSRKALDAQPHRDHNPPVAHDAHVHSRSNAQATVGETGPADNGSKGNASCDEESRAAGDSQEGENMVPRTDILTHGEQAIADERSGERENGSDTSGGHRKGSVTPCIEAIEETAVIKVIVAAGSLRDDRRGGSPAYRRGPPANDWPGERSRCATASVPERATDPARAGSC
ncbi:unnamed protein product [Closterium sp. NIES-53]